MPEAQFKQLITAELTLSTSDSSSQDTGMSAQLDDRCPTSETNPGRNKNGTDFSPGDTAWFYTKEPLHATGHRVVWSQYPGAAYPVGKETLAITTEIVKFTDTNTASLQNACAGGVVLTALGANTLGEVILDTAEGSDGKTLRSQNKGFGVFLAKYNSPITMGTYTFQAGQKRGTEVTIILGADIPSSDPCGGKK